MVINRYLTIRLNALSYKILCKKITVLQESHTRVLKDLYPSFEFIWTWTVESEPDAILVGPAVHKKSHLRRRPLITCKHHIVSRLFFLL